MSNLRTVKRASLWVSALSLLLVLGFFYLDIGNPSPGEITLAHAQEPSLANSQNCVACHGSSSQSMAAACLSCHVDIGSQLSSRKGVHGTLSDDLREDCSQCHSEHHGREFAMVTARSFSLAGIPDRKSYDHADLDFRLSGKHGQIACDRCHGHAQATSLPKGSKRFLGLDQRCTSCHEDVHKGSYGADCASCHGQEHPFPQTAEFEHTLAFALTGSHAGRACVACHERDSSYSVAKLLSAASSAGKSLEIRACRTCHPSPHSESFLIATAQELNLDPDRSCQHCHDAAHETFVGPQVAMDTALHSLTGFPLDRPHDAVSCERCHEGFGQKKDSEEGFSICYPGRRADDCRACHSDPHQGQFEKGPWRGSDCLSCHDRDRFRPSLFGLAQHDRTQFPLAGAHRRISCNKCHTPSKGKREAARGAVACVFNGTPTECRACHVDPHRDQFHNGSFAGGSCSTCHNQDSFAPATFTLQQHDQTRFPLTGAHRAVSCNACHLDSTNRKNAVGEKIAIRGFLGTPTSCQSCHKDVHDGTFDRPGLPVTVANQEDCARCHTTERFDQLRVQAFDHELWTGYKLEAAHARAECVACHKRSVVPDELGRTLGRVASKNCQACHNDPHVGQFGPSSRVDCSRCHAVGDNFRDLVFNHETHSAFKIDEVHAKLDCSKCHTRYRLPGGTTAIRYKPLGTKCIDCHDPGGRTGKARRNSQ